MNLTDTIEKLETLSFRIETNGDFIEGVVYNERETILELNKDQLLLGRNTDGEPLAPDYLSDPFFSNPEAAKAYAERKYRLETLHQQRITHVLDFPNKEKNTPNLIIRGDFQDQMYITGFTATEYIIGSKYEGTPDIETKYHDKVFGLSPQVKRYFYEDYIRPKLIKRINFYR